MRDTSLLLMPSMPSALTRSSTRRVETPATYASDDREQGPLGAPPRLEQRGEVGPVADPRDGELDGADAGVPAPVAVPVAAGEAALGIPLAVGEPGELGHLRLHDRLGEHAHALAEEVRIPVGDRLAQRLEQGHAVVGHRGVLSVVDLIPQRREDDAVAAFVHGLTRCHTNSRDATAGGRADGGSPTCPGCPLPVFGLGFPMLQVVLEPITTTGMARSALPGFSPKLGRVLT